MKLISFFNNIQQSGKTFLSHNIANLISDRQMKVLLVVNDIEEDIKNDKKLFNFLDSKHIDIKINNNNNNLHILSIKINIDNSTDIEKKFNDNLQFLSKKYDVIIFDCSSTSNLFNKLANKLSENIEIVIDTSKFNIISISEQISIINRISHSKIINFIINNYNPFNSNSIDAYSAILSISKRDKIFTIPTMKNNNTDLLESSFLKTNIEFNDLINRLLY